MGTTNEFSNVYIRNQTGTVKVYMDLDPYWQFDYSREKPILKWTCEALEASSEVLLFALYQTYQDVYVSLNNGVSEFLCRWSTGMSYKAENRADRTYKVDFEFEILSGFTSTVYISDESDTPSSRIYMDVDPYPFPEPVVTRNETTIEFACRYISASKYALLKTRYEAFETVTVSLDGGTTKYLCKFPDSGAGITFTKEARLDSYSVECKFIVIYKVSTPPYSNVYIADFDGNNKVYMDIDPFPFPERKHARDVDTLEWTCEYISATKATSLRSKYEAFSDVEVSLDNGTTKYYCRWGEGVALDLQPTTSGNYKLNVKFNVMYTKPYSSTTMTGVYIADTGGANKIYMDYRPYPFPEPQISREGSTLEWNCLFITDTKAASLITKYKTFSNVEVSLDNGATKYNCRWADGVACSLSRTSHNNIAVSVKFAIIETVGASKTSKIYFRNYSGGGEFQLDKDPTPFPYLQKKRIASSKTTLRSNTEAAQTVHFDAGSHISSGNVVFTLNDVPATTIASLQALYDTLSGFRISIDNKSTWYYARWDSGESFRVTYTGSNLTGNISCNIKITGTV